MQCKKVSAPADQLLDPTGTAWSAVPSETLSLDATPLANQPSGYIKASRNEREIGKVRSLNVQSAHNGQEIFVRLSWGDPSENTTITDTNMFPDGCGVLMPLAGGDPPIDEMGSQDAAVNAWFWRADFKNDKALNQIARGLGTTLPTHESPVHARGVWQQGTWTVVFARALSTAPPNEAVQLAPGNAVKVGFAVWEGSNGERAGVKSFSKEWRELALEA